MARKRYSMFLIYVLRGPDVMNIFLFNMKHAFEYEFELCILQNLW